MNNKLYASPAKVRSILEALYTSPEELEKRAKQVFLLPGRFDEKERDQIRDGFENYGVFDRLFQIVDGGGLRIAIRPRELERLQKEMAKKPPLENGLPQMVPILTLTDHRQPEIDLPLPYNRGISDLKLFWLNDYLHLGRELERTGDGYFGGHSLTTDIASFPHLLQKFSELSSQHAALKEVPPGSAGAAQLSGSSLLPFTERLRAEKERPSSKSTRKD